MATNSSANMVFPPGFRFLPSNEELIKEYLRPKIMGTSNDPDLHSFIPTIDDLCKSNPRDLPSFCSNTWNQNSDYCYFFCKWKQYGKGARCDRRTENGYWKKTGKELNITDFDTGERIGIRSILVFYEGRNPGVKTEHVMHVCELKDGISRKSSTYVVCRLKMEKKKTNSTDNIASDFEFHGSQQEDNNGGLSQSQESFFVDGGEPSANTSFSDTDSYLSPADTQEVQQTGFESPDLVLNDQGPPIMSMENCYVTQMVNSHVGIDDTLSLMKPMYSPEHYPCAYEDSDVSPIQLSKLLFPSLDEQFFSGTSQQFHGLPTQFITPEIGTENLPEYPVEGVDWELQFPAHRLFGEIPSSS